MTNKFTHNEKGYRNPYITEEQILKAVGDNPDQGTYEYAQALGETSQIAHRALVRAEKKGLIERRLVCRNMPLWSLVDGCFKEWDSESVQCRCCNIAVECCEAST